MRIPKTGMISCLQIARVAMAPRGSEDQRPRGILNLASTDPIIMSPIGELAAPKKVAASITKASRGCPSGAGGMFVPGTLGINNACRVDTLETMSETTRDNTRGDERLLRNFTYRPAGRVWRGEELSADTGMMCSSVCIDDCVSLH